MLLQRVCLPAALLSNSSIDWQVVVLQQQVHHGFICCSQVCEVHGDLWWLLALRIEQPLNLLPKVRLAVKNTPGCIIETMLHLLLQLLNLLHHLLHHLLHLLLRLLLHLLDLLQRLLHLLQRLLRQLPLLLQLLQHLPLLLKIRDQVWKQLHLCGYPVQNMRKRVQVFDKNSGIWDRHGSPTAVLETCGAERNKTHNLA